MSETAPVYGFCDPRFEGVKAAFQDNFDSGRDVGASVAISVNGEIVVDLWGGWTSDAKDAEWEEDTIVCVYSTTKTMAALSALLLADRGELDFDAPVARYWPEFAENGKADIKVSHIMSHSAGLSGMDEPCHGEQCYDHDYMVGALARQAPWWEAGTASGYHAVTQGNLIGEVIKRITGQSLGQFFAKEIAGPLDADFHIGFGPEHDARVARLIPPEQNAAGQGQMDPESVAVRTFMNPSVGAPASYTREWKAAELPASNGHGNARSIVRVQTAMANDGFAFGKQLLSPEMIKKAMQPQISGTDLVLGIPITFGLGYGIGGEGSLQNPRPGTIFWGGWGGSNIVVDVENNICFGYAMNRMDAGLTGDPRAENMRQAMYEALG